MIFVYWYTACMQTYRPLVLAALGSIGLTILSTFIWLHVNHERPDLLFGYIVTINNEQIILHDRSNNETTLHLQASTTIASKKGENDISNLQPGTFIQATGHWNLDGTMDVDRIRKMTAPNRDR